VITLDIDAVFQAHIDANQKTWEFDRKESLGASEAFGCIREGFFKKRGDEFGFTEDGGEPQSWGAMERGNLIENHFFAPAFKHHLPEPLAILYEGDNQKTLVKGRSSATPDGLITGLIPGEPFTIKVGKKTIVIDDPKSDCIVVENKSHDSRANVSEEKARHRGQTIVQMGLMRETTKHRPYYAIIVYIDASFIDHISAFVVEFDLKVYEFAKKRADQIWAAKSPLALVAEGKLDGSCEYCKFTKA
jgi:hypothetical protein